jgi:hypothetical protein
MPARFVRICLVLKVSEAVSNWMKRAKTPPVLRNHFMYPILLVSALYIFRMSKINLLGLSIYLFNLPVI